MDKAIIGKRFQFNGDWQTEPGTYIVTGMDEEIGMYHVAAESGYDMGWWFGSVVENAEAA